MATFAKAKFTQATSVHQAAELCRQAMCSDNDMPVKVEAAMAIQNLLSEQEQGWEECKQCSFIFITDNCMDTNYFMKLCAPLQYMQ